jgi:hypothetical protein
MQRFKIVVGMDVAIDDILAQVADRCLVLGHWVYGVISIEHKQGAQLAVVECVLRAKAA